MGRELKKYGIRSTRKPARNAFVATTIHVVDENGLAGYCYISFADALVEAIGKVLPRGVAEFDPAYIYVEYDTRRRVWKINAQYLLSSDSALLWESGDRPTWLKLITNHGVQNGSDTQKPIRARAGTGSDKTGSDGPRRKASIGRARADASGVAIG